MTSEVWFVTGSSSGFGLALVTHLLDKGYSVVVTARNLDSTKPLLAKYPNTSLGVVLDVTKKDQISKAVLEAIEKFKRIDVLVNNAGNNLVAKPMEAMGEQNIRDTFELNVFGLINVTNEVLPHLRSQKRGHIINFSSIGGFIGFPNFGAYAGAKHAVVGISEAYKRELNHLNIRVSVICPSSFKTKFGQPRGPPSETPKVIEDYAVLDKIMEETAKSFRTGLVGDPVQAAIAVEKVHKDPKSPFRVFIGKYAVEGAISRAEEIKADAQAFAADGIACDTLKPE